MATNAVNLPPGFELDQQSGSNVNLPPGFELDNQPQQQPASWSNMPSNAMKDVNGILDTVKRVGKGVADFPSDVYQTGKQMVKGQPFSQTPIGQDVNTAGNAALQSLPHMVNDPRQGGALRLEPGSIFRQYQDIASVPFRALPGKAGEAVRKEYPNPVFENPVNTALAVAPLASPAVNAAREIPAVDQGLNKASQLFRGSAENFGRRALGKSKALLAEANQAAGTALDQGVIKNPITNPFSSGPEDMLKRAEALDTKTGQEIGSFTKSQPGSFDYNAVVNDLDNLKSKFHYDPDAINRIENAQEMIRNKAFQFRGDIPFDEANQLKSYIQKKVPWQSDAASAEVGQSAAGTVRSGLDQQLENVSKKLGNPEDFTQFKKSKKIFGDTQNMQKSLLQRTKAESRNLPISPYSAMVGVGEGVRGGSVLHGVLTTLGAEWVKRYGSATAASMLNDISQIMKPGKLPNIPLATSVIAPISQAKDLTVERAREYFKQANGDKEKAMQMAQQDGYK